MKSNQNDMLRELKFLYRYVRENKRNFILFFIGWHVEAALNILLPLLLSRMIDEMVYYKNIQNFFSIAAVILIISLFFCSLYFFIYFFYNNNYGRYASGIKLDLFDHLLKMRLKNVEDKKSGTIMNIINQYTNECITIINRNVIYTLYCFFIILFYVAYIFSMDVFIGICLAVFVMISTFTTILASKKMRNYADVEKDKRNEYQGWLLEIINGIKSIKYLNAQDLVKKKLDEHNHNLLHLGLKKQIFLMIQQNIMGITNLVLQMFFYYIGAVYVSSGRITVGVFVVLLVFYNEIKQNILYLNSYFVDLRDRVTYVRHIREFFKEDTEECRKIQETVRDASRTGQDGIYFEDVHFSYQEDGAVLEHLSLQINPNDRIAIVGKSGGGKTTMMNLLFRFIDPKAGSIYINGIHTAELSHKKIRSMFGYVQQNSTVFNGSIRYNLQLGNKLADEAEMIDACKKAGIYHDIIHFEHGFDTIIGDNGAALSAGQAQRLSIARIYLKNPPIILFDESTSALDQETEVAVHEAWKAFADKTIIVVSHRLETVLACSRTAVLKDGKISEIGTTKDIVEHSAYFKQLFSIETR